MVGCVLKVCVIVFKVFISCVGYSLGLVGCFIGFLGFVSWMVGGYCVWCCCGGGWGRIWGCFYLV